MYKQTLFFLLLIGSLLFGCTTTQTATTQSTPPVEFVILQINDVYEIAPLEGGKVGGLARVAGLLRQLEAENPNTIAVLAGDFLSPSFMGTLKLDNGERIAGLQMVEALNAMGLDYATFGNHEFDLKNAELLEKRLDQSEFEYMSTNAYCVDGEQQRPFQQNGVSVPEFSTFTFEQNGTTYKLGIVGVVLPFAKPPYVGYKDVEATFAAAVKTARQETDIVIGLTHLSVDGDEALAAAVPGLPLFMGGHEHENLSRYVGQTAITKADANAKTVYIHRFTYYPDSKVTQLFSELVPIDESTPEDPATAAVVGKWQAKIGDLISQMGYDATAELTTLATPLNGTEAATRTSQTNYGLLTNQAIAKAWPGADVYAFNSGSLRLDDNLSGAVTAYDVLRSFPYGGPMVRLSMKGDQLARLLNTGETTNRGEGGYLQRYQAEKKGNKWIVNGNPLDNTKTYIVVLPEFMAKGFEANLDFLSEYTYDKLEEFTASGETVKNDIRDMVIWYMGGM